MPGSSRRARLRARTASRSASVLIAASAHSTRNPLRSSQHRRRRQHERFGEQLHHDPAPGGTEGPPHENLPLTRRGSSKHQQRDVAADHHEKQRAEGVDRMNARPESLAGFQEGFGVAAAPARGCSCCFGNCSATRGCLVNSPEPPGARCQSPDGRRRKTGPRPGSCGSSRTRSGVQRFAGQGTRILPA